MQAARELPQHVHSGETNEQRTRLDISFPRHRAFSCRDSLGDRRNAPHVRFLLGSKTHVVGVMSSSFSCFSIFAWTVSFVSYPSRREQEQPEKFPNSVKNRDVREAGKPVLGLESSRLVLRKMGDELGQRSWQARSGIRIPIVTIGGANGRKSEKLASPFWD